MRENQNEREMNEKVQHVVVNIVFFAVLFFLVFYWLHAVNEEKAHERTLQAESKRMEENYEEILDKVWVEMRAKEIFEAAKQKVENDNVKER